LCFHLEQRITTIEPVSWFFVSFLKQAAQFLLPLASIGSKVYPLNGQCTDKSQHKLLDIF
jgi:hypothetical protein